MPTVYEIDENGCALASREAAVTVAATSGNEKNLLLALQERIARALDDPETPARDLASLSKRLLEIGREIKAAEAEEKEREDGNIDTSDEDFDPATV